MPQKIINIGTAPDSGDGDPLRTAFAKSNENFSELYAAAITVSDTSISDHSNPSINGSIAAALESAGLNGGGTVTVGPGEYLLTTSTLVVPRNTRLIGSGMGSTKLTAAHPYSVVMQDNVQNDELWSIEGLHISMPGTASGSAIEVIDGLNLTIRDILITGGSPYTWGISMANTNIFLIERVHIEGEGNGIHLFHRVNNSGSINTGNFGDGLVIAVHVHLYSPDTTGIKIAGPSNSKHLLNNILVSQCEIAGRDAGAGPEGGCIGVHIYNSNRITLLHVDSEIVHTCFLHEGKMDGGVGGSYNAFIQCFPFGANPYVENGIIGETLIIGGHDEMLKYQRVPSDTISVFCSPTLGYLPLRRSYGDIEHYVDSSVPRALSIHESGMTLTNKGATGTVVFKLPPALNAQSMEYTFMLRAPEKIRIVLGNNNLFRPSSLFNGVPGKGKTIESDTAAGQGSFLHIKNIDDTVWCVLSMSGNWTFL
jgi:hypothetical protein